MKRTLTISLLAMTLVTAISASAFATDIVTKNFSYNHCALPDNILDKSFSDYFESKANIFEGTVIETGKVPNKPSVALNECWIKVSVTRWYQSNVNLPEVAALFDTDPSDIPRDFRGETYCSLKEGDSILAFADEYKRESGTGNIGFFLHRSCSLVIPLQSAKPFQRLLGQWVSSRGEQK